MSVGSKLNTTTQSSTGLSVPEVVLCTQRRARNFEKTLQGLLNCEFPYGDGRQAARRLLDDFLAYQKVTFSVGIRRRNPSLRLDACTHLNGRIAELHVIAGIILRSTNTRNAFEIFDPLKRMAEALLGTCALVLSSEWHYSPFALPSMLKGTIFIGMPAVEAGCILFAPLAGHELGHALWQKHEFERDWRGLAQEVVVSKYPSWSPERLDDLAQIDRTVDLVLSQVQEIYSDFVGLHCFGDSYLRAFFYVTSPGSGRPRDASYPSIHQRAEVLWREAEKLYPGLQKPDGSLFQETTASGVNHISQHVQIADSATAVLVNEIAERVQFALKDYDRAELAEPIDERIVRDFRAARPSRHASSLSQVTRAAWLAVDRTLESTDGAESEEERELEQDQRVQFLGQLDEVALKTIEVIEYKKRLSEGGLEPD